ncbi:putative indole-3-glycerol phosphate synthase domain containing protein [Neospora caninum Liverpool]|uniref:indole-3-glycerol-phosphate synthase n=1 Tax=Neospora caninum (strain Liverpool) TaxID=572307 RepID=F0VLC8_NEOCL|nr:putative indole-3-glycerol phosphate synthase domain containing protein [Neospora caninum Liverpool]CBZ54880.1 putative indole-3-glycerol phosphate synthase domain containing protein [Neospora caninum Liverpool]CEL69602.1 TPA: indole-3-glycerol phosphate synthase domain containing protein, putative [Neospora caninum Liverpool]|eukprot:XP_003884908.1 putative indole-3-glycerol phosphate synthase domain containing protein [Neospora caninum Liverpool]
MLAPARLLSRVPLLFFLLSTAHHFAWRILAQRGEGIAFQTARAATAARPSFLRCPQLQRCSSSRVFSPGPSYLAVVSPASASTLSLPSLASFSSLRAPSRPRLPVERLPAPPANAPQALLCFLPGCTLHKSFLPLLPNVHGRNRQQSPNDKSQERPASSPGASRLRASVRDRRLPSRALDQLQRLLEAKQYEVKLLVEKHGSLLDPLALRQAYVHHTLNSKLTERMRIQTHVRERDEKIRAMHAARWQERDREAVLGKDAREEGQEPKCEQALQSHSHRVGGEHPRYDLQEVLQEPETPHRLSVACDLKRRSCTNLAVDPRRLSYRNPGDVAVDCASAGADVILVNTNKEGWGGSYEDLEATTKALRNAYSWSERPAVVMKDIIIHPIQIAQAVEAKADGVYLHFCVAGKDLEDLLFACSTMGTQALVEVHSEAEAQQAEDAGATLLVVNQWDRYTGRLIPEHALRVRSVCSPEVIVLASGGLTSTAQATKCAKSGFDGVVLGQALTRPGALDFIKELKAWQGAPRELVHLFAPDPRGAAAAARGLEEAAAAIEAEDAALKAQREARRAARPASRGPDSETLPSEKREALEQAALTSAHSKQFPRPEEAALDAESEFPGDEGDLDVAEKVFEEAKRGWKPETHAEPAETGGRQCSASDSVAGRPARDSGKARKEATDRGHARTRDRLSGGLSPDSTVPGEERSEARGGQSRATPSDDFTERVLRQSGPDFQPQPAESLFGPRAVPRRNGDASQAPAHPSVNASSGSRDSGRSPSPASRGAYPAPPAGIVDVSGEQDEEPSQRLGQFHAFSTLRSSDASEGRDRRGDPPPVRIPEGTDCAPNEEQLLRACTRELLGQIAREQHVKRMADEEHRDLQLAMFRQYQRLARASPADDQKARTGGAGPLFVPPLALQDTLQTDPHFRSPGPEDALDPLALGPQDADSIAEPFKEAFPNDPARAAAACTAAAAAAVADPSGFAAVARDHLQKAAERGAYTLADSNDPAAALSAAAPTFAAASATAALTAAVARGERDAQAAAKSAAAALRGAHPPSPKALAALAAAAVQERKARGDRPDQWGAPFGPTDEQARVVDAEPQLLGASLAPRGAAGRQGEEARSRESCESRDPTARREIGMVPFGGPDEEAELFDEAELERIGRLFFTEEELDGFLRELRAKKATRQSARRGGEEEGVHGRAEKREDVHSRRQGFHTAQRPDGGGEEATQKGTAVDTAAGAGVRTGSGGSLPMCLGKPPETENSREGQDARADKEGTGTAEARTDGNGVPRRVQTETAGGAGAEASVEERVADPARASEPSESSSESRPVRARPSKAAASWQAEKVSFSTQEWFARANRRKKEDHELVQHVRQQTQRAADQPAGKRDGSPETDADSAPDSVSGARAETSSEAGASFRDGGRETFSRFGRHAPGPSLTTPMDQMEAFLPFFQGRGSHHHLEDPPEVQERMQQEAFLEELKRRESTGGLTSATLTGNPADSPLGDPSRTGQQAYELLEAQQKRLQAERRQRPPAASLRAEAVAAAAAAAAAALADGAPPQAAVQAVSRAAGAATVGSAVDLSSRDREKPANGCRQSTAGETEESVQRADAAPRAAVQGAMLGGERGAYAALWGTSSQGAGGFFESYVDELAQSGGLQVEPSED